jgi:hypothetical protein
MILHTRKLRALLGEAAVLTRNGAIDPDARRRVRALAVEAEESDSTLDLELALSVLRREA